MTETKKVYQSRFLLLSAGIVLVAFFIFVRLFFLQVIHKNEYSEKADRQYATPAGSIFERGTIFFTRKDGTKVSAGTMMTGFKIAINPKQISNPESVYEKINQITPLDKNTFFEKVSKKNDPYEEIANRVSKEIADQVELLDIQGVTIYKEKWRFYPGNNLASQTIGFVGFKGKELIGRYGLERSYNSNLVRSSDDAYVNFFAEVFTHLGETFFQNRDKEGDIITTIEPEVQIHTEEILSKLNKTWEPESAGMIIMDPKTGEIYAMSSVPTFNPNNFSEEKDVSVFSNPIVERVYEMGSVIKPLVMASALDAGVVDKNTTYIDKGSVVVADRTINNFDHKARGKATMQTVLDQSLNTGMVFVEQKLGKDVFRDYMLSYGIGEKTGVDLPGEVSGLVSNLKARGEVEYANASFGQGIALTPVGAIRAFASLANGGTLVTPHVVKSIDYKNGSLKEIPFKQSKNGFKNIDTPNRITEMLVHVVDNYADGRIKLPHYQIAGKTGTAQIALPNGGGYYSDRHMHSFFGYFPASNPRFIIYMYIRYPKGAQYASQTLLPAFMDMAKFMINYYQIPPDR